MRVPCAKFPLVFVGPHEASANLFTATRCCRDKRQGKKGWRTGLQSDRRRLGELNIRSTEIL